MWKYFCVHYTWRTSSWRYYLKPIIGRGSNEIALERVHDYFAGINWVFPQLIKHEPLSSPVVAALKLKLYFAILVVIFLIKIVQIIYLKVYCFGNIRSRFTKTMVCTKITSSSTQVTVEKVKNNGYQKKQIMLPSERKKNVAFICCHYHWRPYETSHKRFSRDYLDCKKLFSPDVKTAASVEACVGMNFEVVVLVIGTTGCSSSKK